MTDTLDPVLLLVLLLFAEAGAAGSVFFVFGVEVEEELGFAFFSLSVPLSLAFLLESAIVDSGRDFFAEGAWA